MPKANAAHNPISKGKNGRNEARNRVTEGEKTNDTVVLRFILQSIE